jgi:glycosyltransferase involved in cell wall biosynthesis
VIRNSYVGFVFPAVGVGGAEKVLSQIANESTKNGCHAEAIILSNQNHFFRLCPEIKIYEPDFTIQQMSRLVFKWRDFWWLRKRLKDSPAQTFLSFGGKYNAFVLLAAIGLSKRIFISDRSRPGISYGRFLDRLNSTVYRLSAGIIAQTSQAKVFAEEQTGHKNVRVIPNPVQTPSDPSGEKQLGILNVGRFITSKHQDWLVNYFDQINPEGWKLTFLGDGKQLSYVKQQAQKCHCSQAIIFEGNVKDVEMHYQQASIFAFTSTSEGFPNALAEAMAHGCACISFDCEAGPSELIDDGVNGFLIPVGDHQLYKEKLQLLIDDSDLRLEFGQKAREKMKELSVEKIAKQYLDFLQL